MNCLEFRKALLTEPTRQAAAIRAHASTCALCRQFGLGAARLEQLLGEVARSPVPPGLEERILLRAALHEDIPPAVPDRRRFLAMAASVGVAAMGALAFTAWRQRDAAADLLVTHVRTDHPRGLASASGGSGLTESATRALLLTSGVQPGPLAGLAIEDAWSCSPLGQSGLHLKLAAPGGPVHVLLCPGEWRRSVSRLTRDDKQVELHPHRLGTLALIAASTPDLEELRTPVLAALDGNDNT
ncbi:MAG TPA: hypothetical protein DCY89_00175 [Gammaproteobacteria bacterium]|nr:hypothetical protein [Gammaproteobacteria bacterium]